MHNANVKIEAWLGDVAWVGKKKKKDARENYEVGRRIQLKLEVPVFRVCTRDERIRMSTRTVLFNTRMYQCIPVTCVARFMEKSFESLKMHV